MLLTWARQRDCQMSFITNRGYAEVQILKTSESYPFGTVWYASVQILKQVAQRATIAHLSPMCQGQISFQKIQTHPSFNACSCYMKVSKGSNQKQQRKSGNTIFPIIRSIGVFLRRSRAANSVVSGPIWPKFELIHNIMHVLVTSKFEKDRINTKITWWHQFFRRSRAANSVVSGGICPKFKLI